MMQKIIEEVVKAYAGYKGLDELKRGIKLAMAVVDLKWSEGDYDTILTEVLYRLAKEV